MLMNRWRKDGNHGEMTFERGGRVSGTSWEDRRVLIWVQLPPVCYKNIVTFFPFLGPKILTVQARRTHLPGY